MALFNTLRAWFWDERGEYHGARAFSKNDKTFKYSKGRYIVNLKASFKEDWPIPLIWKRKTYQYDLKSSIPRKLGDGPEPPITPEQFDINMDTKVLRDLNDLAKGDGLLKYLTPKNIAIALIIGVVIWYISTGHKIL